MKTIRKETLQSIYLRSNTIVASIYVLMILIIVLLSDQKLNVFWASLSIPVCIYSIEYIRQKWNAAIDEYLLPVVIILVSYLCIDSNFKEPFWLFYFVIIYRIILFIVQPAYKFLLILGIILSLVFSEYVSGTTPSDLLEKLVSIAVFAAITHLGFEYMLNYQEQLHLTIQIKRVTEQNLLKFKKELEEAQRIGKLGNWEVDLINRSIFWSKQVYDIHEKPYEYTPIFEEAVSFYDEGSRPVIAEAVRAAAEEGKSFDENLVIISANGIRKYIRVKGEAAYENGVIVKIVGIFQDISRERLTQEKLRAYATDLEKKNKELDQFAYVVSHDLKAPLRGINNLANWIEEDLGGTLQPDAQKNFDLLKKRVRRMENLINGILEYARAGRQTTPHGYTSVYEVIQDIFSSLDLPHNLKVHIVQPLPFIMTNKIALEQVFSNLITNAIKHNNNLDPEVRITAETQDAFIQFCVADNGPGIPEAYHEKIFSIFQTLESRDKVENTGVGLSIVKKIVEEMGGKVWVQSTLGEGAHFYFTWPK